MMRVTTALVLVMAAHAGQEFEVASVKAGDPASPGSSSRTTPAGIEFRNATLKTLVRGAYGLNEYQLEGGPKWMDSARFNIDAKLPAGAPRDQMPMMMRALLADRFKLAFHRETKQLKEYALVVAKGGAKLAASSEDDRARAGSSQGDRMIMLRHAGIDLGANADQRGGSPVIDRTGLGELQFRI